MLVTWMPRATAALHTEEPGEEDELHTEWKSSSVDL